MGQRDAAPYSNQGWGLVFFFLAFVTAGGCKCAEAQRQEDLARLPQSAGSLQEQLAAEAAGRPSDTPTLEALTTATAKAGIAYGAVRQVYGKKLLASYCASVDSLDGMIITVCEYPTEDQAKRGQAESELIGKLVAGHQSRLRKKSVLQLVTQSVTPVEHVAKVLSTFDGL